MPSVHAVHPRSAVALPATDWPWPAGQVDQAAQLSVAVVLLLTDALNVSEAQAVHALSLEVVPAVLVYVPATQAAV